MTVPRGVTLPRVTVTLLVCNALRLFCVAYAEVVRLFESVWKL